MASQTYARDWTEFDGRMCLSAVGAERVGRLFAIQYFETSWQKEEFTDSIGKGYRYVYECRAAMGNRVTYALGVYSSRDDFLGKCDGQYKALEEVDENNIRRAAYSLMKGNAIKSLLGLRGIPKDEWQTMMRKVGRKASQAGRAASTGSTQVTPAGPQVANQQTDSTPSSGSLSVAIRGPPQDGSCSTSTISSNSYNLSSCSSGSANEVGLSASSELHAPDLPGLQLIHPDISNWHIFPASVHEEVLWKG